VPVTLPNGATWLLPRDLFFCFEADSVANASPSFLSNVPVVPTEHQTVTWEQLFEKGARQL